MLKMIKIMHDNGITIVPGTDDFVGFILHRELENYAKAGISNSDILKIATLTSAQVAGKANDYGTIEKGKVADLIILDGNPLKNMKNIRKVSTVVKGNDIYYTKELFKSVSIKYF